MTYGQSELPFKSCNEKEVKAFFSKDCLSSSENELEEQLTNKLNTHLSDFKSLENKFISNEFLPDKNEPSNK